MAETYSYSIADDFPGGAVNTSRLQAEIGDSSITKTVLRIDTEGDDIDIVFDAALTAGEKTTLDGDTTGPAGGLIAAHVNAPSLDPVDVVVDPSLEAIEPDASIVVANGRPAVEIQANGDGWGALQGVWPYAQNAAACLRVTLKAILKATGTGTVLRLGARAKAHGAGEDSSAAWTDTQYVDVTVSHTTLGEVFEGVVNLDASTFDIGDAVALQVGRNGSHANDTLNQAAQIIGIRAEVC